MIDLTDIKFQAAEPGMPDYGVLQEPILGGITTKIDRIGGGFTMQCTLPPEAMEPDGRRLIARCQMAKRQGAQLEYPQVDFNVGSPGAPTVNGAVAGGMTLPITGATPNYAVRPGQALNIVKAGRTYLYFAAQQTILNGSGAGSIVLTTMLRTQLAGGEAVGLKRPIIEGWIRGENFSWPIDVIRTVGLSFDLVERA